MTYCYGYLSEYLLWYLGLTLLLFLATSGMTVFACRTLCRAFTGRQRVFLSVMYGTAFPVVGGASVILGSVRTARNPLEVQAAVSRSLFFATALVFLLELIVTAVVLRGYASSMVLTRLTDGILLLLYPPLAWFFRWLPFFPFPKERNHNHVSYDFILPLLLFFLFLFIKSAILNKTLDDYPVGRCYVKWGFLILMAVNVAVRFFYHPHLYYDCNDAVTHRGLLILVAVNLVAAVILSLLNFVKADRKIYCSGIDASLLYWPIYIGVPLLAMVFLYFFVEYMRGY